MATKIRLMRLGKMRAPYYRVVVADSRTKRDGRVIETIGKYHPKDDPSFIEIDNERAVHWLKVGAQPTEPVAALLKITGAWQEFKGLPAPEGVLQTRAPKADKKAVFEEAARAAMTEKDADGGERRAGKAKAKPAEAKGEAKGEPKADAKADAKAEPKADAKAEPKAEAKSEAKPAEAATEAPAEAATEAPAEAAAEAPAEAATEALAEAATEAPGETAGGE